MAFGDDHWAIIDSNGLVKNIAKWDGVTAWQPPEGHTVVKVGPRFCQSGHVYDHEKDEFRDPNK